MLRAVPVRGSPAAEMNHCYDVPAFMFRVKKEMLERQNDDDDIGLTGAVDLLGETAAR